MALKAVFVILALAGVILGTEIQKFHFSGRQNVFAKSEANHVNVSVPDYADNKVRSSKVCANHCAVNAWCGAFYVTGPTCHLIDSSEIGMTTVAHGAGPGHVYYTKEATDKEVSVLTDAVLL